MVTYLGYSSWGSYSYTTYYAGYTGTTTSPTTTAPTTTTPPPVVFGTPTTPVPPDAISSVTGIDPAEIAAATYGKIIPIFVGGMPRLGCHIIFGPTFATSGGITYASFGVSFGMPALSVGTREIRELRLDGFKVWSLTEGYLMTGLTFRFYQGSETQAADPLVIAAYPAAPVAHKGHCCVFIENLALTDFNLKVPFVSAVIADTLAVEITESSVSFVTVDPADGINLGYALDVLSFSPYVGLGSSFNLGNIAYGWTTEDEFDVEGISERIDALIVAEQISFLELINRFARLHLWDVVQTNKLKIIERGTVSPDVSLDFTSIISAGDAPPILIERAPPSDRPRELEYSYIDIDRDYEVNSITVGRMSVPGDTTRSEGKDTIALPVVHTAQEATSWATLRNFKDELARETISFTASIAGYEIEPGDVVAVDAGFKTYNLRVLETLKGANWTNRIKAEPILRCAPPTFSSFEPDTIATLKVWYKGDEIESVGNLAAWPDSSGQGFHATQTTEADKPSLAGSELNGMSVVKFTGADSEWFNVPDLSGTGATAGTLFLVIKATNDPGLFAVEGATYLGQGASGNQYPGNDGIIRCGDLSTSAKNVGNSSTTLAQWNIIGVNSALSDWRYYINGTQFFSTATNAVGFPTAGRIGVGGSTFPLWDGWIAEVIIFGESLAQSNREKVEGYLAHKWNLTSLLDVLHPYKILAP